MIAVRFDTNKEFSRQMQNLVKYSEGFVSGIEKGKQAFLGQIGIAVKEILEDFIDVNARVDKDSLHHVYEWYNTGSPEARLFDISYTISNLGLSFKSNFSQSQSIADGSTEPFYDKAKVMESGISITIRPKNAEYLKFDVNGDTVFTPNAVSIPTAGGSATTGAFEKVFDSFFQNYFRQSFLQSSGIRKLFSDTSLYKKNVSAGLKGGRSVGVATGYRWITNVGMNL